MADFSYTVGVDIDSSGIDAFVQKVRGLANVNFGTSFNVPPGISASGPGIAGGVGNFTSAPQALGFAQSTGAALSAQLAADKASGKFSAADVRAGQSAINAVVRALTAGARKMEQVLGGVKGPITQKHLDEANRQAQAVVAHELGEADKREARNARKREARAAEKAAKQAEAGVTDGDKDAQARREKTQAHRREADAAKKAASAAEAAAGGRGAGGGGGGRPSKPSASPDGDDGRSNKERLVDSEIATTKRKELDDLQKRLRIAGSQTAIDISISRTKAEVLVAEQKIARAEREQAAAVFKQARAEGFFSEGTRTQRVQAAIKSRGGTQIVDPLGERKLGQLLGQRVVQASSFAIGGLAFYGALQVLRDTLEESQKLERELNVVRGQIERTFGDQSAAVMDRFKERVREISLLTGSLGSEVAFVTRQLAAAFVDAQAAPDVQLQQFELAGKNAEQAFKFSQVTGLDSKEITDSLTAIGLSFDELDGDFGPVLDRAVALEEEFGVLGGQIITFTADLAPLAANLGFTAQQLEEVGASAQKFSGRSGGSLAEQFGRILTDLPSKASDLIGIFSKTPQLADLSSGLADAFVSENMEKVLEFILVASNRVRTQNLDPHLVQEISESVAGRREGASFAAILRQPQELLTALQSDNDESAGAVDRRWTEVRKSLAETMERLRRSVEQLAQALLDAGLVDALKLVANVLGFVARQAGALIRFFDQLNDATGGVAGQMLGLYAIVKTLDAAMKAAGGLTLLGLVGGTEAAAGTGGLRALLAGGTGGLVGKARGIPAAIQAAVSGGAGGLLSRVGGFAAGGLLAARGASLGGTLLNFPSAIGGTAAGVAAPLAAIIALNQLRLSINDVRATVKAQGASLSSQAGRASTFDLLTAGAQTDTRFLGIPGTQKFGRAILGDLPEDILPKALADRAGAAGLNEGLASIDQSKLSDSQKGKYGKAALEVEKALLGEDGDLESVARFLREVGGGNEVIAKAIAESIGASVEVQDAAEEVSQGTSGPNFQQLLTALAGGRSTPESVSAALAVAVAPLQTLAEAALKAGDYTTYLTQVEQIAQLKEAADKGISQFVSNTVAFAENIRGIFGQSTPQTQIDSAIKVLQDPLVTDDETRLQALQQLQSARDAAFQQRLDAAHTEEEKLALLAEGPGVDPIAQAESIYQQISRQAKQKLTGFREIQARNNAFYATGQQGPTVEPDQTAKIAGLEILTRETIAGITDQLLKDIAAYGEGAIDIRIAILNATKLALSAAIKVAAKVGAVGSVGKIFADLVLIQKQIGIYQALKDSGVDPGSLVLDDGNLDPQAEANRVEEQRNYNRDLALARIALAQAQANGDPVREAQLGVQSAQVSVSYARGALESLQAQAQLVSALNAQQAAFDDVARAQLELRAAQVSKDPLEAAKVSLQQADQAIAQAHGAAAKIRAQIQRINAVEQLAQAMRDIVDSQVELAITIAAAGGDAVEAARLRMQQAVTELTRAKKTGDDAAINKARGDLVDAQRGYADSILDKQEGDIGFALEMGNITKRQALESYQQLLTIPTNTEEQNRELQLIIKRLKGELGQDFQFNLPTSLGLPTAYEVQRFDEGGGTGSSYQDNRIITVNVSAATNADPNAIAATVAAVIGQPNRVGAIPRRYS